MEAVAIGRYLQTFLGILEVAPRTILLLLVDLLQLLLLGPMLMVSDGFSHILRSEPRLILIGGPRLFHSLPMHPLWPACWLVCVDKSRSSPSAEIKRIWEFYDDRLQFMNSVDKDAIHDALAMGDVFACWLGWSTAAEIALADAFVVTGGVVPDNGLKVGSGKLKMKSVALGGPKHRKSRSKFSGPTDGGNVWLYSDVSTKGKGSKQSWMFVRVTSDRFSF